MAQEILIKLPLHEERSGSNAMTTACKMNGVTKVEIIRERNHLVVTGKGVDSVKLTRKLRRTFCFADILSVRNVTVPQSETMEEGRFEGNDDFPHRTFYNYPTQSYCQSSYNYIAVPVQDPDPPRICSIM